MHLDARDDVRLKAKYQRRIDELDALESDGR
jgi:hypothetical protein